MKKIKRADLEVSAIALGGNIFGCFTNEKETADIIHEAKEFGINFIDTADVYSDGLSEEYVGRAINGDRAYWKIATKVGIFSGESPSGLGRASKIVSACEASLVRLKTDYIDLYQIHNFDRDTPLEETLSAFNKLKKEGKILSFGVSNYFVNELEELVKSLKSFSGLKCASLQIPYNALRRDAEIDIIPYCMHHGIDVLPYNVLARGVLSGKYAVTSEIPKMSRAAFSASVRQSLAPRVMESIIRIKELAEEKEMSMSQLMLAWALHRPGITALFVGIRNLGQLNDNIVAADIDLDAEDMYRIDECIGVLDDYVDFPLISHIPKCENS